jgi:tetratricopeptide (TPR) repeat protein
MIEHMKKITVTLIATSLLACSYAIAWTATAQPAPAAAPAQTTKLSHKEILTHMLIADMAMQREQPDVALENYLIVAQYTQDPEVAQLATELAIQTQEADKAKTAAEIWANAQPTDLQAQLIATALFITTNPDKSLKFLNHAFAIGNTEIDQNILAILNQLPPEQQNTLANLVYKIATERQADAYAQLAAAQVAAALMSIEQADKYTKLALKLNAGLTSAIELNAKLIRHTTNDDKPALAYLQQQVNKSPNNSELRLFYVSALLDSEDYKQAIPNLSALTKDKKYGGEAYIMLGEIYVEQDKLKDAEANIKQALAFPDSADKAKFYLGQMAEYNKDNTAAIKWYEDVNEDSEYQTQAYLRAAYLYALTGNYDDALNILQNASPESLEDQKQVLLTEIDILTETNNLEKALEQTNRVLAVIPDDADFLYERSVIYGLQDKPKDAEKDLRLILKDDPNNTNALNALGFTLANQPARVKEAMPILEKAMGLNPDNPAIMDSMGWLLFKMGRLQDSINMLNKAYSLSGDNEIAAHLGEVLWTAGKKDDAKTIWNKALHSSQDPKTIHATLDRLKVPLAELDQTPAVKATPKIPPAAIKAAN